MGSFFLDLLLFLVAVFLCFYIPGKYFFYRLKIKLDGIVGLFLALTAGLSVFLLAVYFLSWLHAELLVLPIILIIFFLTFKAKALSAKIEKKEYLALGFISVCSLIFSLPMTSYGIFGDSFAHRFDDLWHLALIQELKVHFPPDIPTYAGTPLKGYHFFSDFLQATVSKFFFISPFSLHFQLFGLFLSFMWGIGVYTLLYTWSKKVSAGLWGVFLTMFGGSFVYIAQIVGYPQLNLQDGFRMLQPALSAFNPPYTLSVILLLFCLTLLYTYLKTHEKKWLIPFIIAAGILPMVKVYAGIILYAGLGVIAIYELYKKRYAMLQVLVALGILFVSTYGLFVWGTGNLVWYPLWAIHEMMAGLHGDNFHEQISTYYRMGVISKIVPNEATGLFLFLIGNLGTRLLGILALVLFLKKKYVPSIFVIGLIVMIITSVLIPLLFIQTGKVFEIIQMTNYYLLLCSLIAAFGVSLFFSLKFPHQTIVKIVTALLFIALTVPSAIFMYTDRMIDDRKTRSFSEPYFQALLFLRDRGEYNQTILELPPMDVKNDYENLYRWYDNTNAATTAVANKRSHLVDGGIIFTGMDVKDRLKIFSAILTYRDNATPESANTVKKLINKNNIHYIISPYALPTIASLQEIKTIYDKGYFVYEVTK